jgi:hypothetical protein
MSQTFHLTKDLETRARVIVSENLYYIYTSPIILISILMSTSPSPQDDWEWLLTTCSSTSVFKGLDGTWYPSPEDQGRSVAKVGRSIILSFYSTLFLLLYRSRSLPSTWLDTKNEPLTDQPKYAHLIQHHRPHLSRTYHTNRTYLSKNLHAAMSQLYATTITSAP